ncbi:hypothetical protein SAMN05443999_102220 [Roseovarius azorensis]|uniref:Uncharacterized protein n=2 Tax=Roseovarius azorensis TaxID=1287727 RepID=A0A1H7JQL6_9RHOB|nr:hypothetical protein SAMN05443999_102220 [Roseovarius azorensis]
MRVIALSGICLALMAGTLWAHASEQGFVLLLPTDVYIAAGGVTVALTVVLLAVLPGGLAEALFRPAPVPWMRPRVRHAASVLAALLLGWLVWRGLAGTRDPLVNPLPLVIWVVFWIGLVSAQGLWGDLWRGINPWTGPAAIMRRITGWRAPLRYPRRAGHWSGVLGLLGFAGFLLADPAPADPGRLAMAVGLYWCAMLVGLLAFGPAWLLRAEAVTVLMRAYARMGIAGRAGGRLALGLPGWQVLAAPKAGAGLAVFILVMLGSGSFDGLNETFWWLGVLGLNPLEFPGRSAVVLPNLLGLMAANAALVAAFAACLWLGERIAGGQASLRALFCFYAPTILPIALAYHIAHYLTAFLVDGQYVLAALSNALGLGHVHVTTGFLNTPGPVRLIWLGQAGVVVAGHVIAILLAHALAMRTGRGARRAVLGQAPLAAFMIAYTVFGLWLLAAPRGA